MNRTKGIIHASVAAIFAAPSVCSIGNDAAVAAPGASTPAPAAATQPKPKNKGFKAPAPKAKAKAAKKAKAKKSLPKKKGKITPGKDRLVPAKLDQYTVDKKNKTAGGNPSVHNGDKVAKMLVGKTLEQCYEIAAKHVQDEDGNKLSVGQLKNRYKKLNAGMQRMNLGNRLRAAL